MCGFLLDTASKMTFAQIRDFYFRTVTADKMYEVLESALETLLEWGVCECMDACRYHRQRQR